MRQQAIRQYDPWQRRLQRESGVTLIELMVALVISAVLTVGAIQIFRSARSGFQTNEALARIQENARFSMNFLAKDLRGLGMGGCAQTPDITSQLNASASFSIDGPALTGTEGGGIDMVPPTGTASDSFTIRGVDAKTNLDLSTNINPGENVQVQDPNPDVEQGDILMITDCVNADVFQVTTPPSGSAITHNSGGAVSPGNNSNSFSSGYGPGANVFAARETVYSLATDANGNPRLQRVINGDTANPEVLVDNVVDMQLTYGEDTDADDVPNAYLPADDVGDWDRVLAVRARITVRSEQDAVTPSAVELDFDGDGTTETAPDNRLYEIYTTTIALRNRLP